MGRHEIVNELIKAPIRNTFRRFGYAAVDLRKDVGTGMLLPGHVKRTLEELSVNCAVDAGANQGDYSAMLRRIGYRGLIVSVEPLRDVCEVLAKRAAGDATWKVFNCALGDGDEIKQFNVCKAPNLSSFLKPAKDMEDAVANSDIARTEIVHVRRLDRILSEVVREIPAPRIFLKMDTQGYDLRVMEGAAAIIPLIVAIQSELSVVPLYRDMPDYIEALAYFRKLGFAPTGFFGVVGHRKTGRTLEFDAVLVRGDAGS